mmetsp:Transcript_24608/g.42348  ORF Transcript_24608/g.42348 Transcript_24608/m.42348 type:complete len:111 (-) Transcript_24608:359-691(-)|eukprot:CAMPEP_0196656568 /NCGR_PEP_ID=MMETSP1086-20130531/18149_1 /TAXON_ID=77921 /ORGANISM="Cyanoptyche  gloeocystis , Strain SAG4.97" /LENGTH=110 /DNA_ID=CAMNT_0041989369 /DNA_START=75 /DNA_END=407 /DNA_ORIENTATION=-
MSHGKVQVIKSLQDFQELVASAPGLVVIDFFATWCGPCKMISPYFVELSTQEAYKDVTFVKVDVDELSEIAEQYGVSAMPTFTFIRKGSKVTDFAGANKDKLKQYIDMHK